MKEQSLRNTSKIGLCGLTYKENVDDTRESPTLQLLEIMNEHLSFGLKGYDLFINKTIVGKQYCELDMFLDDIEILVVLVVHTQNIFSFESVYKL